MDEGIRDARRCGLWRPAACSGTGCGRLHRLWRWPNPRPRSRRSCRSTTRRTRSRHHPGRGRSAGGAGRRVGDPRRRQRQRRRHLSAARSHSWRIRACGCCAIRRTGARATRSAAGCSRPRGDLRLMCDADCAPSLVSLPAMEACSANARSSPGPATRPTRRSPATNRSAPRGQPRLHLPVPRVMGEPLRDVFCGFKLFTAAAAEDVFSRAGSTGGRRRRGAGAGARAGLPGAPVRDRWAHRPGSRPVDPPDHDPGAAGADRGSVASEVEPGLARRARLAASVRHSAPNQQADRRHGEVVRGQMVMA